MSKTSPNINMSMDKNLLAQEESNEVDFSLDSADEISVGLDEQIIDWQDFNTPSFIPKRVISNTSSKKAKPKKPSKKQYVNDKQESITPSLFHNNNDHISDSNHNLLIDGFDVISDNMPILLETIELERNELINSLKKEVKQNSEVTLSIFNEDNYQANTSLNIETSLSNDIDNLLKKHGKNIAEKDKPRVANEIRAIFKIFTKDN